MKMLVLVLSVVAHSRGSSTTCVRGKRNRAKRKQMVRELIHINKIKLSKGRTMKSIRVALQKRLHQLTD